MFDFIYAEEEIIEHTRTQSMIERYPAAQLVPCARYGEIFNRAAQNFRLQKKRPALILAHKAGNRVLPAPSGYGIGSVDNYYFSHMLNCLYDCRYCFLQGMYRSAHMVLFVNYEDFQQDISDTIKSFNTTTPYFFSGYDCDSLAMEGITNFTAEFLPFFAEHQQAYFELRTKSIRTKSLLTTQSLSNCVVAFSMTPPALASEFEAGAPPVSRRLEAIAALQQRGWPIGLRFDPLIYDRDYQTRYRDLFAQVFSTVEIKNLHSVSLGQFRLPREVYKTMHKLYPDEKLLAYGLQEKDGMVSYHSDLARQLHDFCATALLKYIPDEKFFPCPSTTLIKV